MLARLRQRGLSRIAHSASAVPLFSGPALCYEHLHHRSTSSETTTANPFDDAPPTPGASASSRSMRKPKPIVTGRNSSALEDELTDPYPNPFIGRDLPYGRKIIFDNLMEEDLAKGNHWHIYNDRFMQHFDNDLVERGWGNVDLWKSPMAKRGCDDITMSHDMDYHFRLHNIGMHLEMMRYIPHLKPLVPEMKADFAAATRKWQDIVEEVLGEETAQNTECVSQNSQNNAEEIDEEIEESETTDTTTTTEVATAGSTFPYISSTKTKTTKTRKTKIRKVKRKKVQTFAGSEYTLNTTINEERALCGEDVIAKRKRDIVEAAQPPSRKAQLKREIELATLKRFVDDKVEQKDFVRLVFVDAMGTKYYVYGVVGETLLQCARRYLVPIDGYCNGFDRGIIRIYGRGPWCHLCQMDISPKYFHLVPPFDWRERAAFVNFRHLTPTSRLGCSVWIRPEFDGMLINIPVSIPNPYGRFQD